MKPIATAHILSLCLATMSVLIRPQLAHSQLPPIIDTKSPTVPAETLKNTTTSSVARIEVSCQDLKTVVRKGDRQATMMTWNTNYFGRNFNNTKRCQVVSERLQQAANANNGTFQGMELASGKVNSQPVICALQNSRKKCDRDNILFTLKPENANNPNVVIQQIIKFGEDGSGTVNESGSGSSKVDLSLGNWERKAFPGSKATTTLPRDVKKGF